MLLEEENDKMKLQVLNFVSGFFFFLKGKTKLRNRNFQRMQWSVLSLWI